MNQKLMIAASMGLVIFVGACRTTGPEGDLVTLPVRIVPLDGQTASGPGLCRVAGSNFLVRLHNPNGIVMGPVQVSVNFGSEPPATRQSQSSPIAPNGRVDVSLPLPGGCFRPDCSFSIRARDPSGAVVQANGSCIG